MPYLGNQDKNDRTVGYQAIFPRIWRSGTAFGKGKKLKSVKLILTHAQIPYLYVSIKLRLRTQAKYTTKKQTQKTILAWYASHCFRAQAISVMTPSYPACFNCSMTAPAGIFPDLVQR